MTYLQQLHAQHKERLARFSAAAHRPRQRRSQPRPLVLRRPDIAAIKTAVARFYDITEDEIGGDCNVQTHAVPRMILMYLVERYSGLSNKHIAIAVNRHHCHIRRNSKRVEELMMSNRSLAVDIAAIEHILGVN